MVDTHIVTGVGGFIGSHLCRALLDRGESVIGIDSFVCGFEENINDFKDNNRFRLIEKDIREIVLDDLHEFNYKSFWHLAARGELYFCRNNPQEAVDININGTINLLQIANKLGVEHFYFSDTSAEYDSLNDESFYPTCESMAPSFETPMGIYGITKMASSQFVRSYGKKFNFGTTLFRYTNIYGDSMNLNRDIPPVIGSFANSIFRDKTCKIYGDGKKMRDFLHINDLTKLHLAALDKRVNSKDTETFNVGSGVNYSIKNIYDLVSQSCYELSNKKSSLTYTNNQPDEAQITLVNIEKAKKILGWAPTIDIVSGINSTVSKLWNDINDNN